MENELGEAVSEPVVEPVVVASPVDKPETQRKALTLQERLTVIDYIRGLTEPVVASTKVEAAASVAEATKVAISAAQLEYLIDQLPDCKLDRKFAIGGSFSTSEMAELRADVELLKKSVEAILSNSKPGE